MYQKQLKKLMEKFLKHLANYTTSQLSSASETPHIGTINKFKKLANSKEDKPNLHLYLKTVEGLIKAVDRLDQTPRRNSLEKQFNHWKQDIYSLARKTSPKELLSLKFSHAYVYHIYRVSRSKKDGQSLYIDQLAKLGDRILAYLDLPKEK